MTPVQRARTRALNDRLRQTGIGGRIDVTASVHALETPMLAKVLLAVRAFDRFDPDNDPHEEHDFGSIEIEGQTVLWKIDYYDATLTMGSSDPSDANVCTRVLTIMLSGDY